MQHCNGWWIGQALPRAEVDGVSHLSDVGSLEVGARTARMGEVMRLTHRATWDERSFGGARVSMILVYLTREGCPYLRGREVGSGE